MGMFSDLLNYESTLPGRIAAQQERASTQFPLVVARSNLKLWTPGDSITSVGTRVIVGVAASYSSFELALLDQLHEKLSLPQFSCVRVDTFDAGNEPTFQFEAYIPGIGKVVNTPLAAIWDNGKLRESGFAIAAVNLLVKYFGINPST